MRSSETPKRKTPRVLGLDDFAWKKGDRYGTLLVDLEARCPVDLLASSGSRFCGPLVTRAPRSQTHQPRPSRHVCRGRQTWCPTRQANR
jgi:hypothetical protein